LIDETKDRASHDPNPMIDRACYERLAAEEILREIGLVLSGARQVREIQGQHLWIGME
jgi:hypothetical protein